MREVKIYDTTLRDGEQCPGASLNTEQKLAIAKQLARLNVDTIEAGFAIASPDDFNAIKKIAQTVKGPQISSLCRAKKEDIERAWEAIKYCERPKIHIFLATSPIHMEKKLRMKPEAVLELGVDMVKFAVSLCPDVEITLEDGTRSELPFIYKFITAVINAGAMSVDIADTVGYCSPWDYGKLFEDVITNVPQIKEKDTILASHCHDDLGMAVVNSLASIKAGASEVHCTINGLGERAGNASLEEIVMALETRKDIFDCETRINTKEIYKTSRLVSVLSGMPVQPNKAIVGANAFATGAGVHQAAVLKDRETYEILKAEDIGLKEPRMVMDKHSGRNALAQKLEEIGYKFDSSGLEAAYQHFLRMADSRKEITDSDLLNIIATTNIAAEILERYTLKKLDILKPKISIELGFDNETLETTVEGANPIEMIHNAIEKLTKINMRLLNYSVRGISGGKSGPIYILVELRAYGKDLADQVKHKTFRGYGIHQDILTATAEAYVAAVNEILAAQKKAAMAK